LVRQIRCILKNNGHSDVYKSTGHETGEKLMNKAMVELKKGVV